MDTEKILELHKEYLKEPNVNSIITKFISELKNGIIDVEFGYRVLLSYFCEDLKNAIKKVGFHIVQEKGDFEKIYTACLRADDFSKIDSALFTAPKSKIKNIGIEKYRIEYFNKENTFKQLNLESNIGGGIFTLIDKSRKDNFLLVKKDNDSYADCKIKVLLFDGENKEEPSFIKEKDGIFSFLPEWDTLFCSKIPSLGEHLGVGYQYFFLIINFEDNVEKELRSNTPKLKNLFESLVEHNTNVINTFSILNSLVLSTNIYNLIQSISITKLTSLMTINFRHTLREHLDEATKISLAFVYKKYPLWIKDYSLRNKYQNLIDEGLLNIDTIKENAKDIDKDELDVLLTKFNSIYKEIMDNRKIQQYFIFDNSEKKEPIIPYELSELLLQYKEAMKERKFGVGLRVRITNQKIIKNIKIYNPIMAGIIFNIFENACKYRENDGEVVIDTQIKENVVEIQFSNEISKTTYNNLSQNNRIRDLIKPFAKIETDKQQHGFGIYYSYILLKEYFKGSKITINILEKNNKQYYFNTIIYIKQSENGIEYKN
jgi:hypothetical protein